MKTEKIDKDLQNEIRLMFEYDPVLKTACYYPDLGLSVLAVSPGTALRLISTVEVPCTQAHTFKEVLTNELLAIYRNYANTFGSFSPKEVFSKSAIEKAMEGIERWRFDATTFLVKGGENPKTVDEEIILSSMEKEYQVKVLEYPKLRENEIIVASNGQYNCQVGAWIELAEDGGEGNFVFIFIFNTSNEDPKSLRGITRVVK